MHHSRSVRLYGLTMLLSLWLTAACEKPAPKSEPEESRPKHETALSPAVAADRSSATAETHATPDPKVGVSSSTKEPSTIDNTITVETIDLKAIVKPMLSRELFKLDPTRARAYFADIAELQPQPSDQSWLQEFQGQSRLPWVENVTLELHEQDGRWSLGHSHITWRPPSAQARALYDRLVAEVKSARKRNPNFGRDESKDGKQRLHVGWSWCKETCEAIVSLESEGRNTPPGSREIDATRPAVVLSVHTPEGP